MPKLTSEKQTQRLHRSSGVNSSSRIPQSASYLSTFSCAGRAAQLSPNVTLPNKPTRPGIKMRSPAPATKVSETKSFASSMNVCNLLHFRSSSHLRQWRQFNLSATSKTKLARTVHTSRCCIQDNTPKLPSWGLSTNAKDIRSQ